MVHGDKSSFSRRTLLRGSAALGALGMAGLAGAPLRAAPQPAVRLPARGNFVIRNAFVMTMEAGTGDIAGGDVHVKDGMIVAVGRYLEAPGARTLQRRGHDRAARPGRDPLAHVEHVVAQHVGREA